MASSVNLFCLCLIFNLWILNSVGSPTPTICDSDDLFPCSSGECIISDFLCDGIPNCEDGSDEVSLVCDYKEKCQSYLFRCAYGACIDASLVCNGKRDCADNSDETCYLTNTVPKRMPEFRSPNTKTTPEIASRFNNDYLYPNEMGNSASTSSPIEHSGINLKSSITCTLPPFPKNGHWVIFGKNGIKHGGAVPENTIMIYLCHTGFKLNPSHNILSFCNDKGTWTATVTCEKTCSTITMSTDVLPTCIFGGMDTPCITPFEGTIAVLRYAIMDEEIVSQSVCSDGRWVSPKNDEHCEKINHFEVELSFENGDDFNDNFLDKIEFEKRRRLKSCNNEANYVQLIDPRLRG